METGPARQLPNTVIPEKYRLFLTPDLQDFTFEGRVEIDVNVNSATTEIVLNAAELTLHEAYITQGDTRIPASSIATDEDAETATINLSSEAVPGPANLTISYQGILNDQLKGFYHSRYQDTEGNEQYLATTQFEATDARRALPCWDEPALKATFQVSMTVPSHLTAVSNTPVIDESDAGNDLKTIHFAETPRMSTYLLAFVVGDLACVEETAPNGTLMRIFATRGNEHLGRFALDTALRLLEYYNDYFGIPYPLEKLDHFAIPDFAAGAMENWGAITYREVALLFDPENSAAPTRQRIVEIIAHEMAHMWFGDLVTMEWWDDLWLNESFASWMGNKATDALFPEWSMWTQFLYQDVGEGSASTLSATPTPSRPTSRTPEKSAKSSTPFPTTRAPPSFGCWNSTLARTPSETGSVFTYPDTSTATPRAQIFGGLWKRSQGGPSYPSWTPG